MHAIQTSGNCIRNTTSDPFAGVAADEIIDPRPFAEILRQWSTFHPEFIALPRKFKVAINGAEQDRAAIAVHDIGLTMVRNEAGEVGFRFMAGGGMGRTPILGSVIRAFLPWQHMLTYTEAVMRVYNLYGRRDNKYKARIKILLKALGVEEFTRQVEAEWADLKDNAETLTAEELARVAAYFTAPAYASLRELDPAAGHEDSKPFANWLARNIHPHKVPGYASVVLSLKKTGVPPGDATAGQMDFMADLAERYSFGELRVTHEQNIVLADVEQSRLFALWTEIKARGLATPNIGLLTDMICCPGGDFCSLANAKSLPIAAAIAERFDNLDFQHDIGDIELNISGCINACGHHRQPHRHPRRGQERRVLPGRDRRQAGRTRPAPPSRSARCSGASRPKVPTRRAPPQPLPRAARQRGERFIDTVQRVGTEPFKASCGSPDQTPQTRSRRLAAVTAYPALVSPGETVCSRFPAPRSHRPWRCGGCAATTSCIPRAAWAHGSTRRRLEAIARASTASTSWR
jgi:sulfite reductase (NADPH) hemoprotein beta-component